jgi:signal transduction histidine kinase
MKRSSRRKLVISAIALSILTAGSVGGRHIYTSSPGYGLPYYSQFRPDAPETEDRWTGLGGNWEIVDGTMRNDANDRGAKLLIGSPNWKDYIVEADVQLLGEGSVGVLARVTEAELGENSFKGYFLGIRHVDNSLVLGAFDFAYHEAARVVLPDPVRPLRWYHVKLKVDGCQITASAWAEGMSEVKTEPLNDPDCFRSGSIALRSNGTGGVWKNVTVVPVDSVARATDNTTQNPHSTDAIRFQRVPPQTAERRRRTQPPGDGTPVAPAQNIRSLLYLPPYGSPLASVRGTVILTRPVIYVQDSSSGVEIQPEDTTPLKIGDEVEVTGEVKINKYGAVIRQARVNVLREAVPVPPSVLTANQVAEGYFDGRFVQVEGFLRTISEEKDGAIEMDLEAGAQSFHAILPPGRSRSLLPRLARDSRLRLRGVSVAGARFDKAADPFVMLVRSAEDVDVVAGPPWWRPSNLILATLVGLGLIFAFNYLYLLAKHWRLRAVAEERERLANEIHDTLAQSFAGIGFQLQAIRNSLPRGAEPLERQVDLAITMTRTSHGEARRSIASLRPKSLGPIGLLPALRECAEGMVKNGNVKVETDGEDGGRTLPPRIKDTLYRIGQEAIANSIRHADPGIIRVRLHRTRDSICLSVEDDGQGFVADSQHTGFGLLGMRKRAESISATLTVRSTLGTGTRVEVQSPIGSHLLLGLWPRPRLSTTKDI